jgi:hypothetical protein
VCRKGTLESARPEQEAQLHSTLARAAARTGPNHGGLYAHEVRLVAKQIERGVDHPLRHHRRRLHRPVVARRSDAAGEGAVERRARHHIAFCRQKKAERSA